MLSNSDKEIIDIIKEISRSKKNDIYYDPDELLKHIILKVFFFLILSICVLFLDFILEIDNTSFKLLVAPLGTIFFGALFLYINSKSENFSLIMAFLTIISMWVGIYLS